MLSLETAGSEVQEWYIVDSGWIRTWLSYVRFGTKSLGESFSSPAPGAIDNSCLLLMVADLEQFESSQRASLCKNLLTSPPRAQSSTCSKEQ